MGVSGPQSSSEEVVATLGWKERWPQSGDTLPAPAHLFEREVEE